ncbi:helix-turn-helix transcriptional regulator [Halomonas caseinilytica]|uniref:Transcriptional regulator, LuxR family n=1 Tax=Halomonas caseinilytica TaxID=438744 RepID=A0A1M6W8P6_9GAMM|nr:helix-turn-helix transcriptional regulator [Halomonas caseinilytica]SHK90133.1 transcriptional regulator, LuxR family [Halomonas caseinilytica]
MTIPPTTASRPGALAELLNELGWHRAFRVLLSRVDEDDFWMAVVRQLARHLTFNTWVALIFYQHRPPTILADSDEDDGTDEALFQDYQRGLYLLDPFYVACREVNESGLVTLDEVAPRHFRRTEYYQQYFSRNIVADEIQLNRRLDEERTLCLSLGATTPFGSAELGVLQLVQPWLLELMRLRMHFEQGGEVLGPHPWHPHQGTSEQVASRHGLTQREREVSQLMLGGGSAKEIARRLEISVETVRAHKKHLYTKLGINSQAELFSLFWQERP